MQKSRDRGLLSILAEQGGDNVVQWRKCQGQHMRTLQETRRVWNGSQGPFFSGEPGTIHFFMEESRLLGHNNLT